MTSAAVSPNFSKSKRQTVFEYALLAICLCVVALRATLTESPTVQSTTLPSNIRDIAYSLSVSAVLIFALVLWFVVSFLSGRFTYRFTGIEPGLVLFSVAAIIASSVAADKRLAISDVAMALAVVGMAILLVQIVDCRAKVRLVLAVIAALGVVSTYQCAEQFFVTNQMTIEQYEQTPQTILDPMGIEPGSLQQFLLEHRLYSGSVRGFFTTRNSVGSFALLACFAAVALFLEKLINRNSDPSWAAHLLACSIAAASVIFGFVLIRSKGAIIGSVLATVMFIVLLRFGDWIRLHRKVILITCVSLGGVATGVIVAYGLRHGRLPGGNPMLVRWQYWRASAKMAADHPLTGVGPGNFSQYYSHYKPAEAVESVSDPHNFVLRVLTDYGPLGLVGFLAMIFIPLWKVMPPRRAGPPPRTSERYHPPLRILAIAFLAVISAALLLIRPMMIPVTDDATAEAMIYVIVTLYMVPVLAFILGFLFLATDFLSVTTASRAIRDTPHAARDTNIVGSALLCVVIGVLVHNLIDFAVFEPGVFTAFWAIVACLIAERSCQTPPRQFTVKPARIAKLAMVAAAAAVIWLYLNYALVPVAASTGKMQRAQQAASDGWWEEAHYLLDKAAQDDSLSAAALSLNGRLYLHHAGVSGSRNKNLLLNAEKCFQEAIRRNRQNFKNFEQLADVYTQLAQVAARQEKTDYLNKALDTFRLAAERYPGCGRLRFKLAETAEQLGKNDLALEQYEETIKIENEFRAQFRMMYPEREEIISRLGEEKYQAAKQRIKLLSEPSLP